MSWLRPRAAGLVVAGLGGGCVLPTAVGLRHDGFVGPVGTTQAGVAYGALGFDATVATTVAPNVQIATAIGWNGFMHAQVEARIGGAVRPDDASASLVLGASGLYDVSEATRAQGLQAGFVFAYPLAPVRLYGGLTVNPVWGNLWENQGGATYSLWTTPTVGLSVRRVGHDRGIVGAGVEIATLVLVGYREESGSWEGPSSAAPALQLWVEFGRTGRGTPRHPPPEPHLEPERERPPAPPPTTAKTLARLSTPQASLWVLPAGFLDLGGVAATLDHPVAIGITEVDRETWARVTNAPPSDDRRPVVGVTLHDAMRFCNALSRLEGYPETYIFEGEGLVSTNDQGGYRLPTAVE